VPGKKRGTTHVSSPRDIKLTKEINKKIAIMDNMQDAMRIINPDYEIRN